jgi:hypothetical protein
VTLYLTEWEKSYIKGLAGQLTTEQQETFRSVVLSRLGSGRPMETTVARVASIVFNEIRRNEILKRAPTLNQGVSP